MKKISKLLIGTNNKGKYKEIKDLLPKYIKTYSTSEFKLKSPTEDGQTFSEGLFILKSCGEHISRLLGNKSLISFNFPLLLVPTNNFIIFFF